MPSWRHKPAGPLQGRKPKRDDRIAAQTDDGAPRLPDPDPSPGSLRADSGLSASAWEAGLRQGLADMGLHLDAAQIAQLLAYLGLLQKWSQVYNLTALRDPKDMLTHHLLDSLAIVAPLLRQLATRGGTSDQGAGKVLDVGSGAGLPGVVIAICCPQLAVTCVDAVAKKVAFVRQVQATLGLSRLQARHARVEDLQGSYGLICSRAFASLADFVQATRPLLGANGSWLAMKGQEPVDEVAALPAWARVFHVEQLHVPGLAARRCIVWMETVASD